MLIHFACMSLKLLDYTKTYGLHRLCMATAIEWDMGPYMR